MGVEVGPYWWAKIVATVNPDVVLDVGANIGQYVEELRAGGYRKRIVSFEPLSAAHAQLVRRSARDPSWIIAPRMAMGDCEGEAAINIAANSFSSSLLSMGDLHRSVAPAAAYIGTEKVPIRRLDSVAAEYVRPGERCLVKIDVQGYEQKVLDGAHECLSTAVALQIEASLTQLYEGEALFSDMYERVAGLGLDLWGMTPVFTDKRMGRLLQVDCFFVRSGATP